MKFSQILHFLPFVALLLPFSLQAQLLKGYGGKLGINLSNAAVTTPDDFHWTTWRTGVNAAFFLEWSGFSFLSFVTQVEYAQRGFVETQYQTGVVGPELLEDVHASTDWIICPCRSCLNYDILVQALNHTCACLCSLRHATILILLITSARRHCERKNALLTIGSG